MVLVLAASSSSSLTSPSFNTSSSETKKGPVKFESQQEHSNIKQDEARNAPNRIVFGSCNSQHYENKLWNVIMKRNASAFIWGGDSIYADDFDYEEQHLRFLPGILYHKSTPRSGTPTIIHDLYTNLTTNDPGYQQILNSNMSILGTWDDHDYGRNNGDTRYDFRIESAIEYVKFLQCQRPHTNWSIMEHRAQSGKGIYGVKVFDFTLDPLTNNNDDTAYSRMLSDEEAGIEPSTLRTVLSERSVAVFLLDIRSHKTPWQPERSSDELHEKGWLARKLQRFEPNYVGDFLGQEQWEWLTLTLQRSTATVNIIVQGLQVHADRFFDGNMVEDWSRFPRAQHQIYQTILQSNVSVPILVSGDVHMAQLLRRDCRQHDHFDDSDLTRMILEVTSSGMTHSWGSRVCARPHSTLSCRSLIAAIGLRMGMHMAHWNHAWTDVIDIQQSPGTTSIHNKISNFTTNNTRQRYQYFLERNFGEFEFNWDQRQVTIRIFGEEEMFGTDPVIDTTWDFDVLSGHRPVEQTGKIDPNSYNRMYQRLVEHNVASDKNWICINYRGDPSFALKLFGFLSPVATAAFVMFLPILISIMSISIFLMLWRRRNRHIEQQSLQYKKTKRH